MNFFQTSAASAADRPKRTRSGVPCGFCWFRQAKAHKIRGSVRFLLVQTGQSAQDPGKCVKNGNESIVLTRKAAFCARNTATGGMSQATTRRATWPPTAAKNYATGSRSCTRSRGFRAVVRFEFCKSL